jgi:hypothetical protein
MAGYIGRVVHNIETRNGLPNPDYRADAPLFWMEYLVAEEDCGPIFSIDRNDALTFPSHGEADRRAAQLRAEEPSLGFVFAGSLGGALNEHRITTDRFRERQCLRDPAD